MTFGAAVSSKQSPAAANWLAVGPPFDESPLTGKSRGSPRPRCQRCERIAELKDSMGRGRGGGNFAAAFNQWSAAMPQPNDLSRSLVALDQNSTIIAVLEMSQSSWLVGGVVPGIERQPCKKLEPSPERLLAVLHRSAAPLGAWPVSDETSKPSPIWRGTDSSNPSPSRGESTNHRFRRRSHAANSEPALHD